MRDKSDVKREELTRKNLLIDLKPKYMNRGFLKIVCRVEDVSRSSRKPRIKR